MTAQDVAEHLNVDPKTICRTVNRGDLPGLWAGGSLRFRREDIDHQIAKQKEATTKKAGDDP